MISTIRSIPRTIMAGALALLAFACAPFAHAQTYPSKPVRFIVPFPPGGGNDLLARELAQYLAEPLGQTVVVDNRPGASTIIGTELAAKAPPDGHTIFMGNNSTLAINPNLYKKLPYDAVKDFAPVSLLAHAPFVLMVHPSLPPKSVKELIALARARPGQLNFGSAGTGITTHLAGEMFNLMARVKVQERISSDGARIIGSTPAVLGKTIEDDIARWGKVIKQTGLSLEAPH